MRVILQVLTGPYAGRKSWLRAGQMAEVGRGEGVTFSIPHDPVLSRVHFVLESDYTTCRIRDNNSTHGTFVNDVRVQQAILKTGDEIMAGETKFLVTIEGASAAAKAAEPEDDDELHCIQAAKAAEVCEHFELDDEGQAALKPEMTPLEFLQALQKEKLWLDAIRFLAHALQKREGAWWMFQAMLRVRPENQTPRAELSAIQAGLQWVIDPSDDNRWATKEIGDQIGHKSPGGLSTLVVLMSGDSVTPPYYDPVPPEPWVSNRIIVAVLTLMATLKEPLKAKEHYANFVGLGIEVAQGKSRWKELA